MYRLCYTEMPWAWFTDADDFGDLHTDDWDDGYRQGAPYTSEGYTLLKVAVSGPLEDANLSLAPDTINDQRRAWLTTTSLVEHDVKITAGCSLDDFIQDVQAADGEVYIPSGRVAETDLS